MKNCELDVSWIIQSSSDVRWIIQYVDGLSMNTSWTKVGMLGSFGFEFALSVGLFTWLGKWSDQKVGTGHILTLVGFGLGLIVAFMSLFKTLRRVEAMDAAEALEAKNNRDISESESASESDPDLEPQEKPRA